MDPCRIALKDAGLATGDVAEVILVGWPDAHAAGAEIRQGFLRQGAAQGREPDEAVAVGAAIQGGVLSGEVKDVLLLDVTPLSLGIETLGGVMTKLIEKNTTIPTRAAQTFSTADDSQTAVTIHVLQGDARPGRGQQVAGQVRSDRHSVGAARHAADRGVLDIDANGILNVSAMDKATGKEQKTSSRPPVA